MEHRYYNGYDDYEEVQGRKSDDSRYGYHGNTAYDLSLFESRSVNYAENRKSPSGSRKKKSGADRKSETAGRFAGAVSKSVAKAGSMDRSTLVRYVAMGIISIVAVVVLLSCQMEQHELMQEISAANRQLETLQQEYLDMSVTFETKMSNSAIEEYATEVLGMQKRDNSITEYVTIGGGDVFEYTGNPGAFDWLQEELDELLSYMD